MYGMCRLGTDEYGSRGGKGRGDTSGYRIGDVTGTGMRPGCRGGVTFGVNWLGYGMSTSECDGEYGLGVYSIGGGVYGIGGIYGTGGGMYGIGVEMGTRE